MAKPGGKTNQNLSSFHAPARRDMPIDGAPAFVAIPNHEKARHPELFFPQLIKIAKI